MSLAVYPEVAAEGHVTLLVGADGGNVLEPLGDAVHERAGPEAEEEDRAQLRRAGFSDRDIWDIAAVAGFFNMTNRVATATDMRPNSVYHGQAR